MLRLSKHVGKGPTLTLRVPQDDTRYNTTKKALMKRLSYYIQNPLNPKNLSTL